MGSELCLAHPYFLQMFCQFLWHIIKQIIFTSRKLFYIIPADFLIDGFGRFGTVLRTTWCGAVLPAGLLLLLIALALLAFDVLLSKRD